MTTRWNDLDRLWGSMDLLRNRMNRLFSDFDRSWPGLPDATAENYPRLNLDDNGDHFLIEAEVPGYGREEIQIRIQGNYLELSGDRKNRGPGTKGYACHRLERLTTSFSRSLTLPADIDHDRVEAKLTNGILSLKLPKAESAKPRQIAIK